MKLTERARRLAWWLDTRGHPKLAGSIIVWVWKHE